MSSEPSTDSRDGELEQLRARVKELEAERCDLSAALEVSRARVKELESERFVMRQALAYAQKEMRAMERREQSRRWR